MKSQKCKLCLIMIAFFCLLFSHNVQAERDSQNASWISLGPEGGRIADLAQHPTNDNILYVLPYGYPCRIHKSTDKGNTWTELSHIYGWGSALAINPNDPSTMYIFWSSRLFKSTNGGTSWDHNTFSNHSFYGGHVDPINTNILHGYGRHYNGSDWYACYFRSTNGGNSWSRNYPLSTAEESYPFCMRSDPSNSNLVYITGYHYTGFGYDSFVYRSTDGGSSWGDVTAGTNGWIEDMVIHPTSGKVFAVSSSGVYRSTNHGNHWDQHSGWTAGTRITMNPNDPNILYTGDFSRCFKSTDGGVNWTLCSSELYGGTCRTILVDKSNSNNVFYATAAGLFKSTDGGFTWSPSNSGLLLANITALKLVPTAPTTMYIAFDNNAVYKTNNARGKLNAPYAVMWDRLPEFYACHNIAAFGIPHANPDHVFAMEGGG